MQLNNFTIKSQEIIQQSFNIAENKGQQGVENGHLLKAMLDSDDHVIRFLLNKISVNISALTLVVEQVINSYPKVSGGDQYLSSTLNKTLQKAVEKSKLAGDEFVSVEHLLMGMLLAGDNISTLLKDSGVTKIELEKSIEELRKGNRVNSQSAEQSYNALTRYALNLNDLALAGKLDPVIGRDEEIRRVLQILSRRTKNNPVLIGEPGVGKTAIAEGLAHRIVNGDVPENLKSKLVYSLDMGALIAGAMYKGEFEERLKSVIKEVIASAGEIVLFIDEIHTLVGAGKSEGAMDAANILKPALARGELRAIGATTLNEYQKYFEKDKALERRFQIVMVNEPDISSAISILRGIKEKYETHHKVRITDDAIIAAVNLSQRYITDRFLPDKAIDLIDEAASKLRLEMNSVPQIIDEKERKIQQLEIEKAAIKREGNKNRLVELEKSLEILNSENRELRARWNNERAIITNIQRLKESIENLKQEAVQAERSGDYGRVAELRYGKIKEAESEIEKMKGELNRFQGGLSLIREEVDQEDIAMVVSIWTGVPVAKMMLGEREKLLSLEAELHKRVVGQEEAIKSVSDAVRRSRAGLQDARRPVGSFIFLGTTGVGKTELARALAEFLFDDESLITRIDMSEYMERHSVSRLIGAPPGYVGYDEGGQLTEAIRRKPYSVVLLDEIEKAHPDVFNILLQVLDDGRLTDNKGRMVNFKNSIIIMTSNIGSSIIRQNYENVLEADSEELFTRSRNEVMDLLRQTIRPEFLNRIDEIIMFKPLTFDEIREIVKIQFEQIKRTVDQDRFDIEITENAIELVTRMGYDPQYGARPVKRVIQKYILNDLSRQIIAGKIESSGKMIIDAEGDSFTFKSPN